MSRAKIYRFPKDGINDEELEALLEAAQCEELDEEDGETDEEDERSPLIVVLTPEVIADKRLERRLIEATRSGCSVISVWPKGVENETTPDSLKKYGTAQIAWNPAKLQAAIAGKPRFESPTGKKIEPEPLDRNKC